MDSPLVSAGNAPYFVQIHPILNKCRKNLIRKSNEIKMLPDEKRTKREWTSRKLVCKRRAMGSRDQGIGRPAALVTVHIPILRLREVIICKSGAYFDGPDGAELKAG